MIPSCMYLRNFKPGVLLHKKIHKFHKLLPVCFVDIKIKLFEGSELGNFSLTLILIINFQWHGQELSWSIAAR